MGGMDELKKSTTTFDVIWKNSEAAMVISDKDGTVLAANPAYLELYGYTEQEVVGQKFSIIFSPDIQKKALDKYKEIFNAKEKFSTVESKIMRKDGTPRLVESKYSFIEEKGKRIAMLSIIHDITERSQAAEMQQRLAAIVASSDDGIISKDLNGIIKSWNKGAEKIFGYEAEEIIGKSIRTIIPAELQSQEDYILSQIHLGNRIDHFQTVRLRKDGTPINVSITVSPIKDSRGKIIGASKIARDITQRVMNEERQKLLESISGKLVTSLDHSVTLQEIARMIVPLLADYCRIVIVDEKRQIKEISVNHKNPAKINLTHELYKNYINDPNTTHGIGKILQTGKSELIPVVDDEVMKQVKNNKKLIEIVKSIGLKSYIGVPLIARGKVLGAMTFSSTKEGRYYNQQDLQLAEEIGSRIALILDNVHLYRSALSEIEQRKKLEKQKDEFIGIASHELKTPVTSIKAYTQVLKRKFEKRGDTNSAYQLAKMDAQINKLADLIGDLLDVTKIQAGKLQFHIEEFDFDELVKEIVEIMQLTAENHDIHLQGSTHKKVYGDKERIGQVITNLISNAIKYSPHNKEIIVKMTGHADKVELCVQDFGVGIEKDKQDKIFERFYRVSGPENMTFPGLGLGLYISSEIIKRLGGKIWVESVLGKGSSFSFMIPIEATNITQQSNTSVEQEIQHE